MKLVVVRELCNLIHLLVKVIFKDYGKNFIEIDSNTELKVIFPIFTDISGKLNEIFKDNTR